MIVLITALIALGLLTAVLGWLSNKRNGEPSIIQQKTTCSTCNGDNDKCEQECMMEAATKDIEYFDDEELDAFKGRPSDGYNDDEVEQFSYILNTMNRDEVAAWCRSLTLRGIALPDQIKDEVIMMIDDK